MSENQNIEYKESWRDEADLMFQDIVDGNIIQMTDRVIETLKSKYLISPIHYEGLQRIEPLEIPEPALREALFNSIIHKDYSGVHIQMKVYNDRIRLWNPGMLPEGMTIEKLMGDHSSQPRNRHIAEVFYRAGFIESWGRGINKICEGMSNARLKMPVFMNETGGVTLLIYRNMAFTASNELVNDGINDGIKLSQIEIEVLHLINQDSQIVYLTFMKVLSISEATVTRAIRKLRKEGYILRKGSRKTGHWILTDKGKQQIKSR